MSATNKLLRVRQIIGDPKATPPIPAIIPICKAAWWAGVKCGRYPKAIKLSPRVTAWREDEVLALITKTEGA